MDTLQKTMIAFAVSLALGLLVSYTYRKTNRGFSYDAHLRFSLLFITMIITMIMSIIGSNIALSLGLIGSLSIIRFRTAIKSVVDMVFIFWAIAAGLGAGAGSYFIAIAGTIVIAAVFFALDRFKLLFAANRDYVLILNFKEKKDDAALNGVLNGHLRKVSVKSSNFNHEGDMEIVYDVSFRNQESAENLLEELRGFKFVSSASLLAPDTNLYV